MMKRKKTPWTGRPHFDGFVLATTLAAAPAIVLLVTYANRPSPLHLIPVVACLLPFAARSWNAAFATRLVSAGLFGVFVLLGALSIGVLFAPSMGLALAGGFAAQKRG